MKIYLYGDSRLKVSDNRLILLATIKFLTDSNRFIIIIIIKFTDS